MTDILGYTVPKINFRFRVRDDSIEGPNPFKWEDKDSEQIFMNKKILIFSLPGAFTPTCSTYQLPNYEKLYDEFKELGIDEVYCVSVNDAFVMNAWAKSQGIEKVKMLPDGNAELTESLGMLVKKENLGFGARSWRYAALIENGIVKELFEEDGKEDNCETDPYEHSAPEKVLEALNTDNSAWPFPTSETMKTASA
jgi:peroxiredoxin